MSRLLRASPLAFSLLLSCGDDRPTTEAPVCEGLRVESLEHSFSPPAKVAALLRVSDCNQGPIDEELPPEAFSLIENDKVISPLEAPRTVTLDEWQTKKDTLILLDLSGSIVRAGVRPAMLDGAGALVHTLLEGGHRISIAGFDGRPEISTLAPLTDDAGVLESALAAAREAQIVDDSTNLNGAIVSGLQVLDQQVDEDGKGETISHGSLVLFTDGVDQAGRVRRGDMMRAVDDSEHSMFAIGVGPEIDTEELAHIGRDGAVTAGDASQVMSAFMAVGERITWKARAFYALSYCSPARAGQRTLTVEVKSGARVGRVAIDYSAEQFGAGCVP